MEGKREGDGRKRGQRRRREGGRRYLMDPIGVGEEVLLLLLLGELLLQQVLSSTKVFL